MSIEKTLNVQKREGCGKGPNGRLRAQKLIPGVFYTGKGENIARAGSSAAAGKNV